MDSAPDIAKTLEGWLRQFAAAPSAPRLCEFPSPVDPTIVVPALAALAAEALARERTLWIVTADDSLLPDLSNALDLRLRPLCLVLPGADYAGRIALRATLSLLKSRLSRNAGDSAGPAWSALRARLQTGAGDRLWRASLAWCARGLDSEAPPTAIFDLFPVRIGPWQLARQCTTPADWVMLIQSGQLPDTLRSAWPGALRTLMLVGGAISRQTALTRADPTLQLRAELEVLGQELAEMELELATAQAEAATFTARYHEMIAARMAELDRVQADLALARLRRQPDEPAFDAAAQQATTRAEQSRREHEAFREQRAEQSVAHRFAPGDDLKKRFRLLAQKIHPDRASDEADRAWRTQLMSEANRAYRDGDAAGLDEVLTLWLEGRTGQRQRPAGAASPAPSFEADTALAALRAEVVRVRQRIAAITLELDRLYGSKLYELFAAARVATRQGRDLLQEMARRIDAQIEAAKAELDDLDATGTLAA